MVNKEYGVMDFGFETYEIINPNYAKLVFKLNNAGNLTIEAIPSLTPGVKPEGTQHGKVPKGTKVFDYETKIIISLSYSDCINISNLANNPKPNATLKLYRNSTKFSKTVTITCNEDTSNNNKYYFTINFDSTTIDGVNTKFKLPMSDVIFEEFATVLSSYVNSYHMIKYYNQVEKAKADEMKEIKNLLLKLLRQEHDESTEESENKYKQYEV